MDEKKPSDHQPSSDELLAAEALLEAEKAEADRAGRFLVKLPSGATALVMKKFKGKHIQQAARIAGAQPDSMTFCMARAAVRTLIDGEPVTLEDILEMDGEDVDALISVVMSGKAPST